MLCLCQVAAQLAGLSHVVSPGALHSLPASPKGTGGRRRVRPCGTGSHKIPQALGSLCSVTATRCHCFRARLSGAGLEGGDGRRFKGPSSGNSRAGTALKATVEGSDFRWTFKWSTRKSFNATDSPGDLTVAPKEGLAITHSTAKAAQALRTDGQHSYTTPPTLCSSGPGKAKWPAACVLTSTGFHPACFNELFSPWLFIMVSPNFLFFKIIIIFLIYGCVGSLFLCEGFLQLRQVGATLHRGARASHYRGLSCCGAQAPDAQAQ